MGLDVAAVVKDIAAEIGTTPSRVALAWTRPHPAIVASFVGARALAGATGWPYVPFDWPTAGR